MREHAYASHGATGISSRLVEENRVTVLKNPTAKLCFCTHTYVPPNSLVSLTKTP